MHYIITIQREYVNIIYKIYLKNNIDGYIRS